MVEAHFIYEPSLDEHRLYLVDREDGRRSRILEPTSTGDLTVRDSELGVEPKPVLRLPGGSRYWHVIGAALAQHGYVPKDTHTPQIEAHLKDAIVVRDRLLGIVERP